MLDKEFIPHQESLELVGLGFDEPVEFFKDSSEEIFDMRTPNDAPCILWQKAFRWFREKYNLDSYLKPEIINQVKTYDYYIWIDNNEDLEIGVYKLSTYEEAELACLRKLIEIVKEK